MRRIKSSIKSKLNFLMRNFHIYNPTHSIISPSSFFLFAQKSMQLQASHKFTGILAIQPLAPPSYHMLRSGKTIPLQTTLDHQMAPTGPSTDQDSQAPLSAP